jgi:aminoglycoside/choline kinase family phosphotransferase
MTPHSSADRLDQLNAWLKARLGTADFDIAPASGDASFRRYYRVRHSGDTCIAMDAPPDKEDSRPFVAVARSFHGFGVNVPEILEEDLEQGFLLIGDLGSRLYLDALNEDTVERLYGDALGALTAIQACGPREELLPDYGHGRLRTEMELFREWLVRRHLEAPLGSAENDMLDRTFEHLARAALEQPRVCVHRDYHSRNLMVTTRNNPGVLDFQDAVVGPVTYDLVSLLRDCYIAWPRDRVEQWALGYHELAVQSGILREENEARFLRWFDLMGVQRHLKAAGIFARLNHRDGKPGYLKDIPRTLGYIVEVGEGYPELSGLRDFLQRTVLPALEAKAAP